MAKVRGAFDGYKYNACSNQPTFESLVGKTFTKIVMGEEEHGLAFHTEDKIFLLFHEQDCCEHVYIESITGDLEDLIGNPILMAEEVISDNSESVDNYDDSETYSFYKLATIKGYVDIRWVGSSNGYYSETVSLHEGISPSV